MTNKLTAIAEVIGAVVLIAYGFWMIAILAQNTCNL